MQTAMRAWRRRAQDRLSRRVRARWWPPARAAPLALPLAAPPLATTSLARLLVAAAVAGTKTPRGAAGRRAAVAASRLWRRTLPRSPPATRLMTMVMGTAAALRRMPRRMREAMQMVRHPSVRDRATVAVVSALLGVENFAGMCSLQERWPTGWMRALMAATMATRAALTLAR